MSSPPYENWVGGRQKISLYNCVINCRQLDGKSDEIATTCIIADRFDTKNNDFVRTLKTVDNFFWKQRKRAFGCDIDDISCTTSAP